MRRGDGSAESDVCWLCGMESLRRGSAERKRLFTLAKEQGRPVVWIHSVTGEVQHFNQEKESFGDPELDFLNGLPDTGANPEIKTPI